MPLPEQGFRGRLPRSTGDNSSKTALDALQSRNVVFDKNRRYNQQLPTASNLMRWGKADNPNCPLCQQVQTNKYVLSTCRSTLALDRYKDRYGVVPCCHSLRIGFLEQSSRIAYCTLTLWDNRLGSLSDLFQTLRPDIAILTPTCIDILELTICHETNKSNQEHSKSRNMPLYTRTCSTNILSSN